jgi:hypothetical protein
MARRARRARCSMCRSSQFCRRSLRAIRLTEPLPRRARQRHPGPHHVACPPPLHAQALAWGPLAALRLHRASRTPTPAAVRWRQRSRQRGRTPAASRRLPGQQQRQAPPTATRPPSFGIQAEAGVPLSVLQLSRPAGPAPPKSVIPTQKRVTEQLTIGRPSRKVLRQRYAGTRL